MATKTNTLTPYRRDGWTTQEDVIRMYGTDEGHARIERHVMAEWGGSHIGKTSVTMVPKADAVRLGLVGEINTADLSESQREWLALETGGELAVEQ